MVTLIILDDRKIEKIELFKKNNQEKLLNVKISKSL